MLFMNRVLYLISWSLVLTHLLAVYGFVHQSLARPRIRGMEKVGHTFGGATTAFSTRPSTPDPSSPTIPDNAVMNGDTLCSFRHCSTVYIEMTDM